MPFTVKRFLTPWLMVFFVSPVLAGETANSATPTITNSIGMKLAMVPEGTFQMGSPNEEKGRSDCETLHEVEISREFYLGMYEVTQKEYEVVMGANPSVFSPKRFELLQGVDTRRFPVET